ncbi:signal transduction histidine kinase, LytS [Paenibacillus algicola]|uniref:Signal transduction histidine kinase, LytS n=1 Tax=Paenibacillus algicola TaxID=2565926 RepID=A0A4P8XJ59_9BACL|nr:histidine kinase [Paenibacillus algicola]QCT01560.1 signal transduction histidine kinase, LytS [Paenibacillus algicola]
MLLPIKTNTLTKMIIVLVLLLIPILVLYSLSNRVSVSVVSSEIRAMKQKDLRFLATEFDNSVDNLSTLAFLLSEDIHIQELQQLPSIRTAYERNSEKSRMLERLRLLNVAERWDTQYSVIAPQQQDIVSTNPRAAFDLEELKRIASPTWQFKEMNVGGRMEYRYVRHVVKPESMRDRIEQAGLVVEVSFPQDLLAKDLDRFKLGGQGDPFMLLPSDQMITNSTADLDKMEELSRRIAAEPLRGQDSTVMELAGEQYLVSTVRIESLNGYLVDYYPLEAILEPIVKSRNLFYGSIGLLLILSTVAAYLLYRNVQRPIWLLIRNVQRLRDGEYSTRITVNPNNEFSYLFERFNDMASDIDRLIHKVYAEQISTREANLKQLQSQINPHFLYNCFALIRSLARLGKKQQVMDMAMHLSKYYRYTTRSEKSSAALSEELNLIESYLEIQKMHIQHLSYEIDVPDSMLRLEVPRLLLQPLVENAVIHGIEKSAMDGIVTISGEQADGLNCITIEDNGMGMTLDQIQELQHRITLPPTTETGTALWNIHQRIFLQFGNEASLNFAPGKHGGMKVRIQWPIEPGE